MQILKLFDIPEVMIVYILGVAIANVPETWSVNNFESYKSYMTESNIANILEIKIGEHSGQCSSQPSEYDHLFLKT